MFKPVKEGIQFYRYIPGSSLITLNCIGVTSKNATPSYFLMHDKLTVALSMGNSINPVEILNLSLDLDLSVCGRQNAMELKRKSKNYRTVTV